MTRFASLLALTVLPLAAQAHMMLGDPSVWGSSSALENPLTRDTENPLCAGKRHGNEPTMTLTAGETKSLPVICGEAVDDPEGKFGQCKQDDPNGFHAGGGCALSISYKKDGVAMEDFIMFSENDDCPNINSDSPFIGFTVPNNLPACDDCTCAWTWIPDPSASGDEMYMNCFKCKIVSGQTGTVTGGQKLRDNIFEIRGAPQANGERPLYKNKFQTGPIKVEVNGQQAPDNGSQQGGQNNGGNNGENQTNKGEDRKGGQRNGDKFVEPTSFSSENKSCPKRLVRRHKKCAA